MIQTQMRFLPILTLCFCSFTALAATTTQPTNESALFYSEPPQSKDVEWLKVPYDKAENEVLALFQRDLSKLEDITHETVIYEVKTSGQFPPNYQKTLRYKLERVMLTAKKLHIKQCVTCDEARLIKTDTGDIRYEAFSSDLTRAKRIGTEVGVDHLVYADLVYTPEDLVLRVRMARASTGQVLWSKEYSSADVVKTRENFRDSSSDELESRDSLARVIIGEIAFTPSISFGLASLPTVDQGNGSELSSSPSVDIFLGEKFDRGRKIFGFFIGGAFSPGDLSNSKGAPLKWSMRFGPRFSYIFNPYNTSTARYGLNFEAGGLIAEDIATPYFGLGPEVRMINRFSASIMPIYIVKKEQAADNGQIQNPDGSFTNIGPTRPPGTFGGLGVLMKVSMTW